MKHDLVVSTYSKELAGVTYHFVSISNSHDVFIIRREELDDLILALRKIQKPIRVDSPVE